MQVKNALIAKNALVVPTKQDCELAWHDYDQGQPGTAGIVDCVSFIVMRRLGITEAFTNDQHFQDAGFKILF